MGESKDHKKRRDNDSTIEANQALARAHTDPERGRPRSGKLFAGRRAQYALNPIRDEEVGPEAESETQAEVKEAAEDRGT